MTETTINITKEQQIELCRTYNNSDIEALLWMKPYCKGEMLEKVERCIKLNDAINDGPSLEELDEYYEKKWELLAAFRIENNMGDAMVDGRFYQ